jgi:hypothetical protein
VDGDRSDGDRSRFSRHGFSPSRETSIPLTISNHSVGNTP